MNELATRASGSLKSFWSRPEGKTGMIVLAGMGVGVLYLWGKIVPFLVLALENTIYMAVLAAVLAGMVAVAISPRTHLVFRLVMRAITGLIVQIDPIGILRDRLKQMRERRDEMSERVSEVSGQIRILKEQIAKNREAAQQRLKEAARARDIASSASSQEEQLRMQLQLRVKASKASRLEKQNISYEALLAKLEGVYQFLTKYQISVDAYIEDTQDQVDVAERERKTINSAYRAFKSAISAIRGNASEEELYNMTLEHLAEDAGRKLGEIEDFQRSAQSFMDDMDLKNGVLSQDALTKLDAFQAKLLGPAQEPLRLPEVSTQRAKVTVVSNESEYADFFATRDDK